MRNLKLEIEYEGTNYAGWQIQRHRTSQVAPQSSKTIQEIIEKALRKILQDKIQLIASGRTDSGVHALGQVANLKTNSRISTDKLRLALNGLLPEDITISQVKEAHSDFHSRFSAKSKVYRYCILNRHYPSALLRNTVYFYPYPLDIKLMRSESRCLLGKHDFKSFCASGSSVKDTSRIIRRIDINKTPYNPENTPLIIIEIEADGFLYNMARNIIGTLIEIGRHKFRKGDMKKILESKDRRLAGPTAPAKGLTLVRVNY